jgi:hypothetical protein
MEFLLRPEGWDLLGAKIDPLAVRWAARFFQIHVGEWPF